MYHYNPSTALEELTEVVVSEKLARAHRVKIAVVDAINFRDCVQPQLCDGVKESAHRQGISRRSAT